MELFLINSIEVYVEGILSSVLLAYGKYNGNEWKLKQTNVLNFELNINKAFKEQVESNLSNTFSYATIKPIIKVLIK